MYKSQRFPSIQMYNARANLPLNGTDVTCSSFIINNVYMDIYIYLYAHGNSLCIV